MATKIPKTRIGLRAITMQQPFAAAMAHSQGLYTRRGKATKWQLGEPAADKQGLCAAGEWVAIHCGQNNEHLKNAKLMAQVREQWPGCPSDMVLKAQQRTVVGLARFVDGSCDAVRPAPLPRRRPPLPRPPLPPPSV